MNGGQAYDAGYTDEYINTAGEIEDQNESDANDWSDNGDEHGEN